MSDKLENQSEEEAKPAIEEKKADGILHDPYEWGKCAVTAQIVWLPDGTVMLGVRNHLDAPILTLLEGDSLTRLPRHASELPIPTVVTIADLLAQLREDLPLRAQAHAEREAAAPLKAVKSNSRVKTGQTDAKEKPVAAVVPTPAKLSGKAPAPAQASLFNFMTGGN